jgi:hypothetical protein
MHQQDDYNIKETGSQQIESRRENDDIEKQKLVQYCKQLEAMIDKMGKLEVDKVKYISIFGSFDFNFYSSMFFFLP